MAPLSAASLKPGSQEGTTHLGPAARKWLTSGGFVLATVVLLLVGAVSYSSAREAHARALWVAHTHEVIQAIQEALVLITDAETGQRGYVLTGRDEYLAPFERARAQLPLTLKRLRSLTADNPDQQARVERLAQLASDKLALLAQAPDLRADVEKLRSAIQDGVGRRLMDQIRVEATAMMATEQGLLEQRARESEESATLTMQVIVAGFALAVALITGSYLLMQRHARERRRAEARAHALNARLTRHAAQLQASNRELEGFSYSVSHDLRIPLRAVSGYAQIMEEDYGATLDDEGRRLLALVRGNAHNMNRLIDDLLSFSRLGSKPLQKAEVDMDQLARLALAQCDATEAAEHASTGSANPREIRVLPLPRAPGDAGLLRQVWTNLVANAIKYSRTRAPAVIEISGEIDDGEAIYRIRDNGVGFDMRYAGKLFGVFQRLHGADEYPGTGVGLAIVQRIVARHGGRIWADARPDAGATFTFTLPLAANEPGDEHAKPAGD